VSPSRIQTGLTVMVSSLLLLFLGGCDDPGVPPAFDEPAPGASPAGSVDSPSAQFVEITEQAGLDFRHRHGGSGRRYLPETMGSGSAFLDIDDDGWMDLLLLQGQPLPGHAEHQGPEDSFETVWQQRLYRNLGDGSFELLSADHGLQTAGYAMGSCAGDINNDGAVDLYITAFGPDSLWLNDGEGRFEDISAASGIENLAWGASCAMADFDRDGCVDIAVVNYLDFKLDQHIRCGPAEDSQYCHPDVYSGVPDLLFRNRCDGSGQFDEIGRESGIRIDDPAESKGLGIVWLDADNDGWQDLYVANDSTRNFLFHNQQDGTFKEVGVLAGVAYNSDGKTEAGMGIAVGDFAGSTHQDLVVTHLDFETNTYYRNSGELMFEDATISSGLAGPSRTKVGFGVVSFDTDNDGDLDLFVANGHILDNITRFNASLEHAQVDQLMINDGQGRFRLLDTERAGTWLSRKTVSRGAAAADIDNDGALDLLITANNGRPALLRNQHQSAQDWIGLDLRSRFGGRPAIGARAVIKTSDSRNQQREVRAGSSYLVQEDVRVHFGLGANQAIVELEIHWPEGQHQVIAGDDLERAQWQRIQQPHPTVN